MGSSTTRLAALTALGALFSLTGAGAARAQAFGPVAPYHAGPIAADPAGPAMAYGARPSMGYLPWNVYRPQSSWASPTGEPCAPAAPSACAAAPVVVCSPVVPCLPAPAVPIVRPAIHNRRSEMF